MKPLPKTITDDIRSILTRCFTGELKHDQTVFHCGTAHCVAGWKQLLDIAPEMKDVEFDDEVRGQLYDKSWAKSGCPNAVFYAEEAWQLTDSESVILFHMDATFNEQFALLELLEKGERVEYRPDFYQQLNNGTISAPKLPVK